MPLRSTAPAVRSSSIEDQAAVRLRVAHLLNTTTLDARAVPPAATLIVRKFSDPLPRQLYREPGALIASPDWERAVQSALREQFHRAIRPARQVVTASTNAVLFESAAELMACLARDLSTGDALIHWWWKSYVRSSGATLSTALTETFCRELRFVPPAIAKLAEWGEAERVISQLRQEQARALLEEVFAAYHLPRLVAAVRSESPAKLRRIVPTRKEVEIPSVASGDFETGEISPPWEPFVAVAPGHSRLTRIHQAFLGVALLLARAPQHARTKQFESQFKRWLKGATQPVSEPPLHEAGTVNPALASQGESAAREALCPTELPPAAASAPRAGEKREPKIFLKPRQPHSDLSEIHKTTGPSERGSFPVEIVESPPEGTDFQAGTSTQLGGLLFLIPFFRALDFFAHVESECRLAFPPRPWALVELFARWLLGPVPASLVSDPIWAVLRSLDGRGASDPPCQEILDATEYRLPLAWVKGRNADSEEPLVFSRRGQRVLIWHPLGFLLIDAAVPELTDQSFSLAALSQLAGPDLSLRGFTRPKRAIHRALSRLSCPLPEPLRLRADLSRFLGFFCPFFRWALLDSIARRSPKGSDSLREMLFRPGHLYVTSTHVDLVMDLESVRLDVRLAGLDANPGWVPELGRVITFHYRG